jgi:hypothetical protein
VTARLTLLLVCCSATAVGAVAGAAGERSDCRGGGPKLQPCGEVPWLTEFRCGSIRVPFERTDSSYPDGRAARETRAFIGRH